MFTPFVQRVDGFGWQTATRRVLYSKGARLQGPPRQRPGDCCTLQWANVDLSRRIIIVTPAKTAHTGADSLAIPIHPALYDVLNSIPDKTGDVLPELTAKYRHDRDRPAELARPLPIDKVRTLIEAAGT